MFSIPFSSDRITVLYVRMGEDNFLFQRLNGRRFHVYFLCKWFCHLEPAAIDAVTRNGGSYTICANTYEEHGWYLSKGLSSLFCPHNAFMDWQTFRPGTTPVESKYDVVMNAVLMPYKNHHLLGGSRRRKLLITQPDRDEIDVNQFEHTGHLVHLRPYQVNEAYNQSKLGVILSTVEGGCFVSSEYLLAGLPVVSCFCQGGREIYYHENNSVLCEPTPGDVNDAIEYALGRTWDAKAIRAYCIEQMMTQREIFLDHVCHVTEVDKLTVTRQFNNNYCHTMTNWFYNEELALHYLNKSLQ